MHCAPLLISWRGPKTNSIAEFGARESIKFGTDSWAGQRFSGVSREFNLLTIRANLQVFRGFPSFIDGKDWASHRDKIAMFSEVFRF
jgi:hypothetical protein